MTRQEHTLMMNLFSTQLQLITALSNLLKSRGVATDDDLDFFGDATLHMDGLTTASWAQDLYHKLAQRSGVEIPA